MVTDKDKELLEFYILKRTSTKDNNLIKLRLDSDEEYKSEYEDLLALSVSVDNYNKYLEKKIFLNKINSTSKNNFKNKYYVFNQILNNNLVMGIAASVLLIIGINLFMKDGSDLKTEEVDFYGSPNPLDSTYNDSLQNDTTIFIEIK